LLQTVVETEFVKQPLEKQNVLARKIVGFVLALFLAGFVIFISVTQAILFVKFLLKGPVVETAIVKLGKTLLIVLWIVPQK
jgi:hypothetical protein